MAELPRSPEAPGLLRAASELRDLLVESGREAERLRHLPRPAVDALLAAGLFQAAAPVEIGGLDLDPISLIELYELVTSIDSATGWNLIIGGGSTAVVASRVSDEALPELTTGDWPIVAGFIVPRGTAERVGGRYRVSGTWSFASGIHHANWTWSACRVTRDGQPEVNAGSGPVVRFAVIPSREVEVHDTWHVSGLRGTGSHDYTINGFIVRPAFMFDGSEPAKRGAPWNRAPIAAVGGLGHASFALGLGLGVLVELRKVLGSTQRTNAGAAAGERESVRRDLGRATAAHEGARLFVLDSTREIWETTLSGGSPTRTQLLRQRLAATYATDIAVEIAQFGARALGTAALFESSPIQRLLRDSIAAQQHIYVSDVTYVEAGIDALNYMVPL